LSRLNAAHASISGPPALMQRLTRSRTIDSFDCKAMREFNTNLRRGSLTYRQDYASYASSSIF